MLMPPPRPTLFPYTTLFRSPLGDLEMGAPHADLQVAHRAARRGDQMHLDAQPLAEHAARVAHRGAVDRVADGGGMNDVAVRRLRSEEHTSELQSRGHLVCRL